MPTEAMKAYCKDALQIQDACNPCGVIQAWARHLLAVNREYDSTPDVSRDAPFLLFLDKLCSLAGEYDRDMIRFSSAYDACKSAAGGNQ